MPYPLVFSDDSAGLAELRTIALAYPGAHERISHGRPAFFAGKMFAMYGGSSKVDRPPGWSAAEGEMVAYPNAVLIKVDQSERIALERDHRFFHPAYLGPAGWLGLDLTAAVVDWAEVGELVDASFRLVAPKKLLRDLDGR